MDVSKPKALEPAAGRALPGNVVSKGCLHLAATFWLVACSSHASPNMHRQFVSHLYGASPSSSNVTLASWYGPGFYGRRTASGEVYNSKQLTAASRTLPLGTHAEVTNLANGRSVRVRINDCGPYVKRRKIDLSRRAAERLGMMRSGVTPVRIRVTDTPRRGRLCTRLSASSIAGSIAQY